MTIDIDKHLREVISETKESRVVSAARELLAAIDFMNQSKEYVSVWAFYFAHGVPYSGPMVTKEILALEEALKELDK